MEINQTAILKLCAANLSLSAVRDLMSILLAIYDDHGAMTQVWALFDAFKTRRSKHAMTLPANAVKGRRGSDVMSLINWGQGFTVTLHFTGR